MLQGKVKYVNADRGFAFIKRDDGQPDVFLHAGSMAQGDFDDLCMGDRVQFEIGEGRKGPAAVSAKLVDE